MLLCTECGRVRFSSGPPNTLIAQWKSKGLLSPGSGVRVSLGVLKRSVLLSVRKADFHSAKRGSIPLRSAEECGYSLYSKTLACEAGQLDASANSHPQAMFFYRLGNWILNPVRWVQLPYMVQKDQ